MNFFLYFGNLFYFDWLKSIYMVICNELIWYCLRLNGIKFKEIRIKN